MFAFSSYLPIVTFPHRCFLWCPVHWHGRSRFTDGERFAGKYTFSVLQHHHLLQVRITRCLTLCLCTQAALSIFGMISGPLLGLYLLGMLFRTTNSIVSIFYNHKLKNKQTNKKNPSHIQEILHCQGLFGREGWWV